MQRAEAIKAHLAVRSHLVTQPRHVQSALTLSLAAQAANREAAAKAAADPDAAAWICVMWCGLVGRGRERAVNFQARNI